MARLQNQLAICLGCVLLVCLNDDVAGQVTTPATSNPVRLTLEEALRRARQNNVTYQAVATEAGLAREDKKQAMAALLPSVNYDNSAIYTEGTGTDDQVKFIANNAVHEYISQG